MIFASSDHVPYLFKNSARFPRLKLVIAMDEMSPEGKRLLAAWGQDKGVEFMEFREGNFIYLHHSLLLIALL